MPILAGQGTLLQQSDMGSPPNWTTIAHLGTISTEAKTDSVDVTAHDSTLGIKQMFPVLKDTGSVKAELFEDPLDATFQLLQADWLAVPTVIRDYRLVIQSSPQKMRRYTAFVEDLSDSFPVNNVVKSTLSLRNFSAPDFNFT
jgi:hypothetical protein